MTINPYAPGTKSHAIAAVIMERRDWGRWATDREIRERVGPCSKHLISKVRARLREDGALQPKGVYSRWVHRRIPVALALALILALPGYPGRWLVLADAEPAVTGGVALCAGGEWPQWCVVEGRGDVTVDGEQVQWVVRLPGVSR